MEPSVATQEDLLNALRNLRAPKMGVPLVQLVMDYGAGDLAVSEVRQALAKHLPPEWQMPLTSVHSFKTTETGFVVGQLALAPRSPDDPPLIVYANCAPRKDERRSRVDNEGEGLVYGTLPNGVRVVAVNSKFSLSLLREHFVDLYAVRIGTGGSQFRSRDNFPAFVALVAHGADLTPFLGERLHPERVIPQFAEGFIGYIDSFGNIKTTFRKSTSRFAALEPGQEVEVGINGTEFVAHVATGSFSVPEGSFAFAPGSSGWDDRFWEIFQRGGTAAESFKWPQVGSAVTVTPLDKRAR